MRWIGKWYLWHLRHIKYFGPDRCWTIYGGGQGCGWEESSWYSWLGRCRRKVGEDGVGTFKKLLSSLVEPTILYGAEIWGCVRSQEVAE